MNIYLFLHVYLTYNITFQSPPPTLFFSEQFIYAILLLIKQIFD